MIEFHPFKGLACDCYEEEPIPPRLKINPFGEYQELMVSDLKSQSIDKSLQLKGVSVSKLSGKENEESKKKTTLLQQDQKPTVHVNPIEVKDLETDIKKPLESLKFGFNFDDQSHSDLKFDPTSSQEYLKDESLASKLMGPSSFNIADDPKEIEPSIQLLEKLHQKNVSLDHDEEQHTHRRSSLFKSVLRENEVRKSMFYKGDPNRLQSAIENGEIIDHGHSEEEEHEQSENEAMNLLVM